MDQYHSSDEEQIKLSKSSTSSVLSSTCSNSNSGDKHKYRYIKVNLI